MKKTILYMISVCLYVCPGWASYTYEVYTYDGSKILHDTESILIDQQGGMDYLALNNSSFATVQGTSMLEQGIGGIGNIQLYSTSFLEMSDGEVGTLDINSNATAILSGGLIESIYSYQTAVTVIPGEPQQIIPNPHITIVYSGDLPTWSSSTNILTGIWGNGDPFSIQLVDVSGFDPAIENIQFELIPEPITLALLGLGGLLMRRKQ